MHLMCYVAQKSFEIFFAQLPPDLRSLKACDVNTTKWTVMGRLVVY